LGKRLETAIPKNSNLKIGLRFVRKIKYQKVKRKRKKAGVRTGLKRKKCKIRTKPSFWKSLQLPV